MKTLMLGSFIFAGLALLTLSGCTTDYSGNGGGMGYENPDPLTQQVRMQEKMSKVTRSLTP
ncbi:MAG: hypothetical protein KDN19_23350 [Verrucomicrobiae bacterium]|nr:hypothetical protein [Verrucomicrobiae bacterium]